MTQGLKVSRPLVEHHSQEAFDPISKQTIVRTGHCRPRLSSRFEATDKTLRGWRQTRYKIKISGWRQPHPVFDVESPGSVLVPWPGNALSPDSSCKVKVRIEGKDETGKAVSSLWSEGITIDWIPSHDQLIANFISSSLPLVNGPLRPLRFRKAFHVPKFDGVPDKAKLYITALGVFQIFINGIRVEGKETIPGLTSNKHCHLYQTYDCRRLLRSGNNVIGVEVTQGWYKNQSNQSGGSDSSDKILGVFAQLDLIADDTHAAITIVTDDSWECGHGPLLRSDMNHGEDYDDRENQVGWDDDPDFRGSGFVSTRVIAFPDGKLIPSETPSASVIEHIKPKQMIQSKSGKVVLDLGQNIVGKLCVKHLTKPADHRIIFRHAEDMKDGHLYPPLSQSAAIYTFIASGNTIQEWSPQYTFHAFRYVEVEGWGPSDIQCPLTLESIEALVVHADIKRTGWFSCSDGSVNTLYDHSIQTIRKGLLLALTKGSHLDTGSWHISDVLPFDLATKLDRWLEDVSTMQDDGSNNQSSDFAQVWWDHVRVLLPWSLYHATGDIDILSRWYPSMKVWLEDGLKRGTDGLCNSPPEQPSDFQEATDESMFVANAYLVHVIRLMSQICDALGKKAESASYMIQHKKIKKIFRRNYIRNKHLSVASTQTGLALAIIFNLFDDLDQAKVATARFRRATSLVTSRTTMDPSRASIITHALSSISLHDQAHRILFAEEHDASDLTSLNHHTGNSIVSWLHKVSGGLSPLEPGWKCSLVRPAPTDSLKHAESKHDTPYGTLSCRWSIDDGLFNLFVQVPPNTTARVVMPDQQVSKISGEEEEGTKVGSGFYEFSCAYRPEKQKPTEMSTLLH